MRLSYRLRFRRDHRWSPGHMSDYLDDEMAVNARARIERHLVDCGDCRRLLAGLRRVVDGLHRLPAAGDGVNGARLATAVRARLSEPPRS